jgi:HEAT repeat protein
MLIAATIALGWLPWMQGAQPAAVSPQETVLATYKMAGEDVQATIPTSSASPLPGVASVSWQGWNYLVSSNGALLGRVKSTGGWPDVQALYAEAHAKITDSTPQWRVKVVVFTRFDGLDASAEGVLRQRRATLEQSMVDRALQSVARFCAVADAYGGGRFHLVPDVDIEDDPIHGEPGKPTFDEKFIRWYFGPRINGSEFDAPDRVYRGPYDSVLFIHAGTPGDGQPTAEVAGTPVTGIAYDPNEDETPKADLTQEELAAWLGHLEVAASKWGIPSEKKLSVEGVGEGAFQDSPDTLLVGSMWAKLSGRTGPSVEDVVAALARRGKPSPTAWADVADDPWRKLPWLQTADVARYAGAAQLVDLGIEGQFHSYALAASGDQVPAKHTDVPALGLGPDVVVGRESLALVPFGERALLLVPGSLVSFVGDRLKPELDARAIGATVVAGERLVVFDVKPPSAAKAETDLLDLSGNAPQNHQAGPDSYGRVQWSLHYAPLPTYALPAGVRPEASSDQPEARALAAAKLSQDSTSAEKSGVEFMLSAREDFVRLNAAQAFTRVKDPNAEAGLTGLLPSYNTRLLGVALRALAFQGSDTAWATISHMVEGGRYDYGRQVATELVAMRNDPKNSISLSTMMTARSWQARLASAVAIGVQKDLASQTILMALMQETDPAVRLAVAQYANPELDRIAHDLLWPAVNDPSEEVRAACDIGLIRSSKDEYRQEGFKGVRDDGVYVRLAVLGELQSHPNAAYRAPLRIAVTDSNASVRAKALRAFAVQPGDIATQEISTVLDDKDPQVQIALVDLAKAKGIKLPPATIEMLKASVDPTVSAEAKDLP